MQDINQHFAAIQGLLKTRRFGLLSDVDGTLSEIAPTPAAATLDPDCRHSLELLKDRLALVALVSGRAAADAREMTGVTGLVYVGNHGLERLSGAGLEASPGLADYPARIMAVLAALEAKLGTVGFSYEFKGYSGAVHYRASTDAATAKRQILAALSETPAADGLRVQQNRKVVDLLPPLAADKGSAVTALIQDYRLQAAVYLGDDRTDLAAFRALRAQRAGGAFKGLAVAVANPEMPVELGGEADFTVRGVSGVAEFLGRLVAAVSPG